MWRLRLWCSQHERRQQRTNEQYEQADYEGIGIRCERLLKSCAGHLGAASQTRILNWAASMPCSEPQFAHELLDGQVVMRRDVLEQAVAQTDLQQLPRAVRWFQAAVS